VPTVVASAAAQAVWLGPGVVLDGQGNPTTNGDGLLNEVHKRDPIIDFNNHRYSAMSIRPQDLANLWAPLNPNIAFTSLYVKAIKVTCIARDTTQTDMFYMMTRNGLNSGYPKFRESLGKSKLYMATQKLDPVAGVAAVAANSIRWNLPENWIGGPVGARIKVKMFYKLKNNRLVVN